MPYHAAKLVLFHYSKKGTLDKTGFPVDKTRLSSCLITMLTLTQYQLVPKSSHNLYQLVLKATHTH